MKIWLVDTRDLGNEHVACIVFAPHKTGAESIVGREVSKIEDIFEIELDDPRWDGLFIIGKMIQPERF